MLDSTHVVQNFRPEDVFLQQDCSAASVCAISGGPLYLANHILQGTLGGALAHWQAGELVEPDPGLPWNVPEEKPGAGTTEAPQSAPSLPHWAAVVPAPV